MESSIYSSLATAGRRSFRRRSARASINRDAPKSSAKSADKTAVETVDEGEVVLLQCKFGLGAISPCCVSSRDLRPAIDTFIEAAPFRVVSSERPSVLHWGNFQIVRTLWLIVDAIQRQEIGAGRLARTEDARAGGGRWRRAEHHLQSRRLFAHYDRRLHAGRTFARRCRRHR